MPDLMTLRFPAGAEYRMSDEAPKVGDVLKRNGDNWIVERVTEDDDGKTQITVRPGRVLPTPEEDGKGLT